jgi:hypothetical protein
MAFRLQRRSLFAGALLAAACYSPTLPLPPPGKPEVSAVVGTRDRFRLTGLVEPHAEVVARNRRTALLAGQLTGGSGRYDFEVVGLEGDSMELWYVVGTEASPRLTFVLEASGPPGPAGDGGAGGDGGAL